MRTKKPTYRKKDGSYERSIVVGKDDQGEPIRAYARGRTKSEMNEVYKEIASQVQRSEYIVDKKLTVGKYADAWLKATQNPARHATYSMYERVIRVQIKPRIGAVPIHAISEIELRTMVNDMSKEGLTRTTKQTLLTLKQIFALAVNERKMRLNVAAGIRYSYIQAPRSPITAAEWDALEAAELDLRDKLLALLPVWAGLRKEEVLALRVCDYSDHRITVSRAWHITKSGAGAIRDYPKTRAGYRTIPLPEPLDQLLLESVEGRKPDELLIQRERGGLFDTRYFEIRWKTIKNRANIAMGGRNGRGRGRAGGKIERVEKFRPTVKYHELRHTYATAHYYAGTDIKKLQYLMGHEDIRTTLDVYTHHDKSSFGNPYPRQSEVLKQCFTVNLRLGDKKEAEENPKAP